MKNTQTDKYNMESEKREAAADAASIRETVAEAKRLGISTAALLKRRRGHKGHSRTF